MKFEYFRFLLTPVKDPQLPLHGAVTRADVINEIFGQGKTYKFKSGRANFGLRIDHSHEGLASAYVGKLTSRIMRKPPEDGFALKKVEDWPGSRLFINLNDEKDTGRTLAAGQMIGFQVNKSAIQNPKNCLQEFANKVNEIIIHKGFYLTINPMPTDRKKFWTVAKEHEGNIRKVVLTYTPPNLFELGTSLEDDLKKVNQSFNTTSTQIVFENEAGSVTLPEDNQLLQETAKYIDEGGGKFKFTLTKGKKTVSSDGGVKTETFDGLELTLENANTTNIEGAMRMVLGVQND
jgi:hypothetical protein